MHRVIATSAPYTIDEQDGLFNFCLRGGFPIGHFEVKRIPEMITLLRILQKECSEDGEQKESEQELWDEIGQLERGMKAMYDSLDRITEGCSNPDAEPIRVAVYAMKVKLERAFEAKFPLVTAIKRYFG